MARWECCDLSETTEFLGMHISCDHKNQKIFIDQCEYLEKVLARFNVATNPTHCHMTENTQLNNIISFYFILLLIFCS